MYRHQNVERPPLRSLSRRAALVGSMATVLLLLPATLASATAESIGVEEQSPGCEGVSVVVPVRFENVDPLVPDEFTLLTVSQDPVTGQKFAGLQIGAVRCANVRVSPPGSTRPTTFATFRVALENRSDPSDPQYLEAGDAYTFWIATDNRDLVRFYRHQGGASDHDAVYVRDLVFELDPPAFTFRAPSAPSPFELTAEVGPLIAGPLNLALAFWAAVPGGVMKQHPDNLDQFVFGEVNGRVTPAPGSEMHRIFCDADGRFSGDPLRVLADDRTASLRFSFSHGAFAVAVSKEETSTTSRATCPARP